MQKNIIIPMLPDVRREGIGDNINVYGFGKPINDITANQDINMHILQDTQVVYFSAGFAGNNLNTAIFLTVLDKGTLVGGSVIGTKGPEQYLMVALCAAHPSGVVSYFDE